MKPGARLSAATCASILALLILGQCRRQEVPPAATAPVAGGGARVAAEAPPAPPVAVPKAADPAPPPPPSKGWIDGNIYRFRLDDVRPCPGQAAAGGEARLGVVVRVASKIDELLVAPRDFKLETGGVILESAISTKAPAGCAPLLAPKSLRAGKIADGVVVFDLPPGFNPDRRPVKITYQPTRWGGAHRVEAILPPPPG